MARIVDANKVDVLRSLDIEEYGTKVQLRRNSNGSGVLGFSIADPRRTERAELRDFIANLVSETPLSDIFAELDRRDEKATQTWGEKEPILFSVNVWLETPVALAISNLFGENDLDFDTRKTVHEALDAIVPSKASQF